MLKWVVASILAILLPTERHIVVFRACLAIAVMAIVLFMFTVWVASQL